MSAIVRELGMRSALANPVVVEGALWGAITTGSFDRVLPATAERRLRDFTELVATAVANTQARTEGEQLAERLGALQRVATLVAKEPALEEVFAKVAEEVANLLGDADCSLFGDEGDGTATVVAVSGERLSTGVQLGSRWPVDGDGVIASVLREGRPVQLADNTRTQGAIAKRARELGIRAAAGCAIVVGERVWGAMSAVRYEPGAFPPGTEWSLAQFADLAATAIANAEARAQVERLADEQAALRRVATLVAEGAPATAVFDAVAAEMQAQLGADGVTLSRYEPHDEVTVVAHRGTDMRRVPPGTRVSHRGENVTSMVRRSKRSARMEHAHRAAARFTREPAVRVSVGAPIIVEGGLWGVAMANWRGDESVPADTEAQMAQFAELLDSAI